MRPNVATACSTTDEMFFSSHKSSETASNLFPASGKAEVTDCGLREVATTESPRCNAARTSSRPKPCEVPVMSQTSGLLDGVFMEILVNCFPPGSKQEIQ